MEWRTHGGDFNTKSLPLSLRGSATAYQGPVSDVGNSGPCPPKPGSLRTHGRAGPLTSPSRSALYAHSVVTRREVWILISPSLSLSLSLSFSFSVSLHPSVPRLSCSQARLSGSRISGLSFLLELNQTQAETVLVDSHHLWRKYVLTLPSWTGHRRK